MLTVFGTQNQVLTKYVIPKNSNIKEVMQKCHAVCDYRSYIDKGKIKDVTVGAFDCHLDLSYIKDMEF